MARVIPGVEIKVVKEIVPQQLYPSGVVGMIGTAEGGPILKPTPVTSYRELTTIFGGESGSLVREAKQAFLNGVFQVFATRIEGTGGTIATANLQGAKKRNVVRLTSKLSGESGNEIEAVVMRGQAENSVRIELSNDKTQESFDNLTMQPGTELNFVDFLNKNSQLVTAEDLKAPIDFPDNNPADVDRKSTRLNSSH